MAATVEAPPQTHEDGLVLLTPQQIAARYPIGLSRLYALIRTQQIRHVTLRGRRRRRYLLRPEVIEAWLLDQEQGG